MRVQVTERVELTPRMLRLTFEGAGLADLAPPDPASSIRLLVPSPGRDELEIPSWNGNEFLLADGNRPALRTFTPLRFDPTGRRIELEIVRHPGGAVSGWAEAAGPGSPAAVSGPGRGHTIDPDTTRHVLLGDETALPAIGQLLTVIPERCAVEVHLEVTEGALDSTLPHHRNADITWWERTGETPAGRSLVEADRRLTPLDSDSRLWAAGEAAAMQAIRSVVFDELGGSRDRATIRGYWKNRPAGGPVDSGDPR